MRSDHEGATTRREAPALAGRIAAAVTVGIACVAILIYDRIAAPESIPDFDQSWFAATAVLRGLDPYALVGEGLEFNWPWPYYYPLTAPVSILPLGLLPLAWARIAFVALPCGFLAFRMTRYGYHRMAFFATGAFLMSVKLGQWGPLVVCGLLVPWLGFFMAAKPNLGLGAFAGVATLPALGKSVIRAGTLTLVAFILQPNWLMRWLTTLSTSPHFLSIAFVPGGFVLLAALLRWRRWEARMLLALALIPQTPGVSGALPLMLIPRSFRALLVIAILSHLPPLLAGQPAESFAARAVREAQIMLLAVFLPLLYLVLRMPNEGPAPAWLENRIASWPRWIRGTPGSAADPLTIETTPTGSAAQ